MYSSTVLYFKNTDKAIAKLTFKNYLCCYKCNMFSNFFNNLKLIQCVCEKKHQIIRELTTCKRCIKSDQKNQSKCDFPVLVLLSSLLKFVFYIYITLFTFLIIANQNHILSKYVQQRNCNKILDTKREFGCKVTILQHESNIPIWQFYNYTSQTNV